MNKSTRLEPVSRDVAIASHVAGPIRGGASPLAAKSPGRWLALAILLTGNFVTILDLFIVNVAIPSIQRGLGATLAEVQLVLVVYAATYGVCLLNGARLGDLFGRRRLFLIGMVLFTIASGLCGIATTPALLIGARGLQGLGAAILMPQVLASIRVLFPVESRRRAFGIMGAVQGVAASISQLAGGALIEHGGAAGWRLVFLINLPIGILAVVAGRFLLTETRAPVADRLDVHGALTGALGLAMLLVPVMEGREYGWPWWSIALPVLSIAVFAHFVSYEKRLRAAGGVPIIDIDLFANRRFVTGVIGVFLFYSSISSFFLSLTLLLQFGLGLAPLAAGWVFTPSAVAFFVGSLTGPKLAHRWGSKALLFGVTVFAAGLALSAYVGHAAVHSLGLMVVSLILNGLGQGLVIPLAFNAILSGVRDDQAGMGSGMLSTMQTVGTATGVTIVGVLLFAFVQHAGGAAPAERYGQALAWATLYNVAAASVSLLMFRLSTREDGLVKGR